MEGRPVMDLLCLTGRTWRDDRLTEQLDITTTTRLENGCSCGKVHGEGSHTRHESSRSMASADKSWPALTAGIRGIGWERRESITSWDARRRTTCTLGANWSNRI